MQKSTIKQAFGGEVPFTQFISRDTATQNRILEALNLAPEDGLKVRAENPTEDSKRVDLTVEDSQGQTLLVIESQDSTGWLDSIHASKIMYYMWDKGCDQGVLLTEDADEYIMSFVRTLNTDHNFSITLLKTLIYTQKDGTHYVDFVPLIRGSDLDYLPTKRERSEPDPEKAELLKTLNERYPGLFTNVTGRYCSHIKLGANAMNVGIVPYKNGRFWVDIWHGGKHNTDTFRETFTSVCDELKLEAKFQQARGYVNGDSGMEESQAISVFREFKQALEQQRIRA